MKAIKKILAVLVCLCVVFGCTAVVASAADTGSITIQNPTHSGATVAGKTFNVYKIFNATTSGTNTSYSWYEIGGEIPFYDFFYGANGVVEQNKADGNVQKAVEYVSDITDSLALSQFAESLHKYINANGIATVIDPVVVPTGVTSINIPDLSYGYYLVYDNTDLAGADASVVRSAVMLSNVNKDAVITLKANRPQILKQVEENNGTFGKGTSVNIGDTVTFKLTTAVPSHTLYTTYKYFIEDTMADGLELIADSIKVYHGDDLLVKDTDYTLTTAQGTVDFKVDFTASMNVAGKFNTGDTLSVVYDAKVTDSIEKANQNVAKLTYSNDPTDDDSVGSVSDSANVYSYQFVFTKFAQDTNGILTNVRLSGAQFNLYKVVGGSDVLVKFTTRNKTINIDGEDHNITEYVVAEDASAPGTTDILETCNEGDATITLSHLNYGGHLGDIAIFGLAEGTYKLVETKAPDGYILPSEPFVIEIVDEIGALGSVGTLNVTGSHTGSGSIVNTNGMAENILTVWAEITNKPGSALPETGGMGTTIFTVAGIVMMVGAAAFFTSRKRSSVA
ncbi:MAG: SpaH/EbpB family LPXTG-anchored major pilin [Clostridia bacterium]|nr:SpaH/EbpB family LPXTG-anchored major pilin [Clostridia bacterium]